MSRSMRWLDELGTCRRGCPSPCAQPTVEAEWNAEGPSSLIPTGCSPSSSRPTPPTQMLSVSQMLPHCKQLSSVGLALKIVSVVERCSGFSGYCGHQWASSAARDHLCALLSKSPVLSDPLASFFLHPHPLTSTAGPQGCRAHRTETFLIPTRERSLPPRL